MTPLQAADILFEVYRPGQPTVHIDHQDDVAQWLMRTHGVWIKGIDDTPDTHVIVAKFPNAAGVKVTLLLHDSWPCTLVFEKPGDRSLETAFSEADLIGYLSKHADTLPV